MRFLPLSPDRWKDLSELFGERGACGGCWCMWWRLPRSEWTARKGAGNKAAFKRIVDCGRPTGILAYADGRPAAWCAVAPREDYPVLQRSRALKPVDGARVWSVTCFFVAKPYRGRGMNAGLLGAAGTLVRRSGGRILEGYPVEPRGSRMPDAFAWTGLASAFRRAGFREVARRGSRPIMRRALRG